jgi:UDP-3-O-acyl-N-acetylglucosamine deacetylase
MQIDNCEVWVDESEMPGCDGSSLPFVEALAHAGAVPQPAPRPCLVVRSITRLGNEDTWVEARPDRDGGLSLKFRLDYGSANAIGRQTLQLAITPETFRRELAPARTFVLREEAEWLVARGLGKRATYQNVLVFDADGPLENELRFRDECVRHKALDLVGDLALAGCDLAGHFVAHRSGHRLNAEMVRALFNEEEIIEGRRRSA